MSRYTGKDVKITFGAATAHFQSIEINIKKEKWNAPSSDSDTPFRGTAYYDCDITLKGWDTSAANGLTFAQLGELALTNAAPSAFSWKNTAPTPASLLPASFFTKFPLSSMRLDDVSGGSAGADKPSEWTAKISVCNGD